MAKCIEMCGYSWGKCTRGAGCCVTVASSYTKAPSDTGRLLIDNETARKQLFQVHMYIPGTTNIYTQILELTVDL